ncbi:MAG TPA: GAF domain-containing protein [Candidatus Polarisedimenticolia bacterium]|nr:GAF domain-containing protein [Candidatus Polarisedimenticolia bacterium]
MEDARSVSGGRNRAAASPPADRRAILERVRQALGQGSDRNEQMRTAVRILSEGAGKYTWTGIYLLEGETLVLHNQIGEPTIHRRIPIGEGICGLAARERRTVMVPDVGQDPRYLACSQATRSEIVVPIMRDGEVVGEIDIDSNLLDAFDEDDRLILEETARLRGALL